MRLRFRSYGSGEALVFLHGLLGSGENWHSFSLQLADKLEVFVPDLRNHGSSPHAPGMAYPQLADDVVEFIDSVVLRPAHVLGHSMGGKVGMQLALQCPGKVRSLTVVDIGPQKYSARHRAILEGLLKLDLALWKTRKQIEDALAEAIPDLATRRFLLKNVGHTVNGTFRWKIGLREIEQAYGDLSAAVAGPNPYTGPALFLKGEKSDYLNAADFPRIKELFPAAEFSTVLRAGHWMQVENPAGLLQPLVRFLQRVP